MTELFEVRFFRVKLSRTIKTGNNPYSLLPPEYFLF